MAISESPKIPSTSNRTIQRIVGPSSQGKTGAEISRALDVNEKTVSRLLSQFSKTAMWQLSNGG